MKFFSIIIPVKSKFKKQKFPEFCEVFYINTFSKSEARNFGANKSNGKYLIHIDKDNWISDELLIRLKKILEIKNYKAIVLEEFIKNPKSVWQKARSLERKILAGNKVLATPQIIEKNLFLKVGGYDERFNELDDWALWMRLNKISYSSFLIPHSTSVFEPTNIFEIFKRRFKKGRELKYFREVYGQIPQINKFGVIKSYLNSYQLITKNVFVFFFLVILKFFDYLGLVLGSLFPVRPKIDMLYKDKLIAKNFDKEQLNFYGRLKDFFEKNALLHQIPHSSFQILDLGCGTGRLTKFLVNRGHKVTSCDISEAMLAYYPKHLPKPILLKSNKLPFKTNNFDSVVSIRVIWHIKNLKRREEFFSEAVRVSKDSIIMDFSFFGSSSDYQFNWREIVSLAKKYKLKIKNYYFLPMGRLLIKFEKKS